MFSPNAASPQLELDFSTYGTKIPVVDIPSEYEAFVPPSPLPGRTPTSFDTSSAYSAAAPETNAQPRFIELNRGRAPKRINVAAAEAEDRRRAAASALVDAMESHVANAAYHREFRFSVTKGGANTSSPLSVALAIFATRIKIVGPSCCPGDGARPRLDDDKRVRARAACGPRQSEPTATPAAPAAPACCLLHAELEGAPGDTIRERRRNGCGSRSTSKASRKVVSAAATRFTDLRCVVFRSMAGCGLLLPPLAAARCWLAGCWLAAAALRLL